MSNQIEKGDHVSAMLGEGGRGEGIVSGVTPQKITVAFFRPTALFDGAEPVQSGEFDHMEVFVVKKAPKPNSQKAALDAKAATAKQKQAKTAPKGKKVVELPSIPSMEPQELPQWRSAPVEIDTMPLRVIWYWIQAQSILTEIKGMEVANAERAAAQETPAYEEGMFFKKSDELKALAEEAKKVTMNVQPA